MSGRYITVEDGLLSQEPHVPRKIGRVAPRLRPNRFIHKGIGHHSAHVPGYRAFMSRDRVHLVRRCGYPAGRPKGTLNGYTGAERALIRKQAEKKAMKDYEKLFAHINEEDPIVEYAQKKILTMLNEPINVKDAHALLRTLLEYRKPKPAVKSQVEITQTQDEWADLLQSHNYDEERKSN